MRLDEDGNPVRPPRARFQISENTLFNAGFDRPTVEALRHVLNAVGNTSDTTTLPEAGASIDSLNIGLAALTLTPATVPPLPYPDDLAPIAQLVLQNEFLQTEVRQLAEQVAALTTRINDLEQGKPQ